MQCNSGTSFLFFVAGLGAGIAMTALLAPQSGPMTRRIIGRKVKDGEDWLKNKATEAQEYVKSQGAEVGDRIKMAAATIAHG